MTCPVLCLPLLFALQSPGSTVPPPGFEQLFNGKDLSGWRVHEGKRERWTVEHGLLVVKGGGGGWLMTEKEYGDFDLHVEYRLPMLGNSGVALRAPLKGDPAYQGMEIQLIDDQNWKGLRPAQHTGSVYDVVPATTWPGKVGQWNTIHIIARGAHVTVDVNDVRVCDADLAAHRSQAGKHPGLLRPAGHLGLQSHDGRFEFRNLYVKPLSP